MKLKNNQLISFKKKYIAVNSGSNASKYFRKIASVFKAKKVWNIKLVTLILISFKKIKIISKNQNLFNYLI